MLPLAVAVLGRVKETSPRQPGHRIDNASLDEVISSHLRQARMKLSAETLNLLPSAARLRGFEQDLGLTDNQFDTTLSIFYVGYITMQVPSYVFCS